MRAGFERDRDREREQRETGRTKETDREDRENRENRERQGEHRQRGFETVSNQETLVSTKQQII